MPNDEIKNLREDIRELYKKSNNVSKEIAAFSSKALEKFEHLPTKVDLTQSIVKAMGSHIKDYHGKTSIAPSKNGNTKMVMALVGAIVTAMGALTAVIYALIQ